ncbi:MAG: DUF349 domain-containing protein [Bacteroidales bacterium]|nr:DUF349 domain-containing protein [Bacteroidales bacterium]
MKTNEQLNQNPDQIEQEENSKPKVKSKKTSEKEAEHPDMEEKSEKTAKKPGRKKKTETAESSGDKKSKTTKAKSKKATAKEEGSNTGPDAAEDAKEEIAVGNSEDTSELKEEVSAEQGEAKADTESISETVEEPVAGTKQESETNLDSGEETVQDEDSDEEEDEDSDDSESEGIKYDELSREELVTQLEEILQEDKIEEIKKRVALIKVAFLKLNKEVQHEKYEKYIDEGGDKEEFAVVEDPIEKRFNEAFAVYRDKRQAFLEEQEKGKQNNLEAKKIILEELKALIDSEESLKRTYDEFKELQEKWKGIGMVPKGEVNNLWQNYHFLVEKFFDKVKINKELRDLDLKKNMEAKIELCEKAEELLIENSIIKSFKQLQKYHEQWKEIGPIPQDKKDEIWERFKNATEKINQRRREHYNKLQEVQKNNYIAKAALCEKAEEILQFENTSIKDWQHNTDQITELLKVWKTIGPAPRKQNDEIWDRFKTSLDTFFTAKKEYFQNIKDEQLNNYNLKIEICVQAEALKTSTDWRKTSQDLINLQKEWKNIGPVPRKHSDKIWKRFRAACDEFFNNKSNYFSNIGKHEEENLKLKESLIQQVIEFKFDSNKNANLDKLKDFQRQWTEIGHVPMKVKDRIQIEFRNAINKKLDELKISQTEMQTLNYKHRIENIKDNPNANRIIYNERNTLVIKRKKLEEEINLWENNIGFLAHSKKADLLRQEFEKKIEMAKKDLALLTEKIKFLNREMD